MADQTATIKPPAKTPTLNDLTSDPDFQSLPLADRMELGGKFFEKYVVKDPEFSLLGKEDKRATFDRFFDHSAFKADDEPSSNPAKQFVIGAVNEALMGVPLFGLEHTSGGGDQLQAVRDFALDKPDTTGEQVARAAGSITGFALGLPAKVYVKGGQLAIKAAAGAFPRLAIAGKAMKGLSTAERLAKGAVEASGGFGAYELLKAPEDEFKEKVISVPMAMSIGAALGVAGEALKPAVSRFVSNVTKGNKSLFTDELANIVLTETDKIKQQFESAINKQDFARAQKVINRFTQPGQPLKGTGQFVQGQGLVGQQMAPQAGQVAGREGLQEVLQTQLDAFMTNSGRDLLDKYQYEFAKNMINVRKARFFDSFTTSFSSYLKNQGAAGNAYLRRSEDAFSNGLITSGKNINHFSKVTKGLDETEMSNMFDVLGGRATPMNAAVDSASIRVRKQFDDLFMESSNLGLDVNYRQNFAPQIIMSQDASGKIVNENLQAAVKRGDFVNMQDANEAWGIYKKYASGEMVKIKQRVGQNKLISYIMRTQKTTAEDAEKLLTKHFQAVRSSKYHNLESARTLNLPFWDANPNRAIPEYLEGASHRIEIARQFGPKDEVAQKIIQEAENMGADGKSIGIIHQRMFGIEPTSRLPGMSSKTLQNIKNFQVVTKLALSAIPNSTQSINTSFVTGLRNLVSGIKDSMTKQGQEFAAITGSTLNTTIDDIIRRSTSGSSSWTSQFLEKVGFTATETMNRTIAANAGKHYVERLSKQLVSDPFNKDAARRLMELGLNPRRIIRNGGVNFDELLKGSQQIVNKTQFQSRPIDLPLAWSSPEGRLITQFKTFAFNQTKLIKEAIWGEVKRGNMAPLITAVSIMPIIGEGVGDVKSILTGRSRDKIGLDRYIENVAYVGSLGILRDAWGAAEHGKVADFLGGPTVGDISEAAGGIYNVLHGKPKQLGKAIVKKIPVFGQLMVNRLFPPEQ